MRAEAGPDPDAMTHVLYRFGRHVLDLAKRELLRDGAPVPLPARVFECLTHLIEHRDRAVDRDELAQAVFSRDDVSDAQLAQIILRTRRAIDDDGHEQRAIRTIPRFGFRWIAETGIERVETAVEPVPAGDQAMQAVAVPVPQAAPGPAALPIPLPLPVSASGHRRVFGVAIVLLIGAIALATMIFQAWQGRQARSAPASAADARAIMVLPARVEGSGDIAWARLGLMDYLADRMRRAGLPSLSSDTTLNVLRNAAGADAAPDVQQLRRAARADWIVEIQAQHDDGTWTVDLHATDRHDLMQRGQAQGRDLLDTARIAGDRLLAALGGVAPTDGASEPGLAERLQRAQSAMLANELDTARRILNDAPELQRSRPQLRYRLAEVDFRAGEYLRGLDTLDDLLAGDAAREEPMFRARLHNLRGAMLIRLDRYAEAEHSYDTSIAVLERAESPVELGRALNGRGVTRSSQGRFDAALSDLGRARVQLLRGGDALAVARVDANLGNVEMDRARPAQAVAYYRKAARDFESMGAVNELAGISGMLMTAELQLLHPEATLVESERAFALLPRLRDPAQRANVILGRAEALIAVGRLSEADRLLRLPDTATVVPGDYKRRDFLRMELSRQAGDPRAVVRIADAALADWPRERRPRVRAWMQVRREQATQSLDLPSAARDDASLGDTLPHLLLRAIRQGDVDAADAGYRAALALAEQRAIPQEIAETVGAYARWLLARGATAEAGGLAGRVAPWAEQDFGLALLQVALYAGLGQREPWQAALARARGLAGERPIPPGLRLPAALEAPTDVTSGAITP